MREAAIVSTARTPIGKAFRGAFNKTHGATLAGHAIAHGEGCYLGDVRLRDQGRQGDVVADVGEIVQGGDDDADVRWVVGEALIVLGRCAVKPLLTALTKSQDSEGYYQASHHVLHDLSKSADLAPLLAPVLAALGRSEPQVGVPVAAADALAKLDAS